MANMASVWGTPACKLLYFMILNELKCNQCYFHEETFSFPLKVTRAYSLYLTMMHMHAT